MKRENKISNTRDHGPETYRLKMEIGDEGETSSFIVENMSVFRYKSYIDILICVTNYSRLTKVVNSQGHMASGLVIHI